MTRPRVALPTLVLLLFPAVGRADVPFNGVTIGVPVGALAQTLGVPADVTSGDAGHRFAFAGGVTTYTDDDGIVLAVDAQSGAPRVEVDGVERTFRIGNYTSARADAELAAVAEFATPTRKSYRLAPRRDLVLTFGEVSHVLERVTYGEPGQLARLGLLPGDGASKAVAYRAPLLRSTPERVAGGATPVVYRLSVDRGGHVTDVAIALPTSRATNAALDESARELRAQRYAPAVLDGRPIAATVFVEVAP
jgi:hypothetical protein